ncbi:hypothetical protein DL770_007677 [Monosporascus sp. CRB-9-2]|nr:hypothetical protein DL770_007677 [Monosporascus sp. CRB-9-2]
MANGAANLRLAYLSAQLLQQRIELDFDQAKDTEPDADAVANQYISVRRTAEDIVHLVQELGGEQLGDFWLSVGAFVCSSSDLPAPAVFDLLASDRDRRCDPKGAPECRTRRRVGPDAELVRAVSKASRELDGERFRVAVGHDLDACHQTPPRTSPMQPYRLCKRLRPSWRTTLSALELSAIQATSNRFAVDKFPYLLLRTPRETSPGPSMVFLSWPTTIFDGLLISFVSSGANCVLQ